MFNLLLQKQLNIQAKMDAQIRMKMQYDSSQVGVDQKRYINVLPNHPYEAYRRLDQQTLVNVKKTERIPIPQLRQLILMFTLVEKSLPPLDESDLLREKIHLSDLNGQNQTLHSLSEQWMMEEERLSKLSQVFEEYLTQREQLISRAVMKNRHNVHESAQKFKSDLKNIEMEKNTRIQGFFSKLVNNQSHRPMAPSQQYPHGQLNYERTHLGVEHNLQPQEKDQLDGIQKDAILRVISHIKSQSDENNQYESEQQGRLNGLRRLAVFLNEFEKALIFIVGTRNISNLNEQFGSINENYYLTFSDKLRHYIETIKQLNEDILDNTFEWQMNIKHNMSYDSRSKQFEDRSNKLSTEIQDELYYFIPKILANLENDREQMKKLTDFFTHNFQSYLGTYYSIKEVEVYNDKQGHVEEVIENQRQSLNNHLKKNFGMMVPYKKSQEYEELAGIAYSKDKPYLKTLLEEKIGGLEQAIAYINYEHSKLYTEACDGTPGVANKIRRKLDDFNVMGSKYPEIRAHLEQSCRRLLEIVNR